MSEAELWEIYGQWMTSGGESMMSWVTVVFAFLVMSHYVGAKLSRFQAVVASVLFVWASLLLTYAVVGYFYRATMFMERLEAIDSELQFFLGTGAISAIAAMMVAGMVVGLLFLRNVRKVKYE